MTEIDDATRALTEEILRRSAGNIGCENSALWLVDEDDLVPVMGCGSHAGDFVGSFRQPLTEGIISMVYASGQPFCENSITQNPNHSNRLDQKLGIRTDAMIAVPVICEGEIAGVITFVHTSAGEGQGAATFGSGDVAEAEFAAALAGRVVA